MPAAEHRGQQESQQDGRQVKSYRDEPPYDVYLFKLAGNHPPEGRSPGFFEYADRLCSFQRKQNQPQVQRAPAVKLGIEVQVGRVGPRQTTEDTNFVERVRPAEPGCNGFRRRRRQPPADPRDAKQQANRQNSEEPESFPDREGFQHTSGLEGLGRLPHWLLTFYSPARRPPE